MQYAGPHQGNGTSKEFGFRLDPWYVTGLVEGEGCFCVSFSFCPERKLGLQAYASFSLSLNERDRYLLWELQAFFDCGSIRESRTDRTFKYEVRSVRKLLDRIVPHFEAYPLRGVKRRSFEGFAEVCEMMGQGHHLEPEGMAEIVHIAYGMNPGKRRYSASTLLRTLDEVKG
jgi:hypothetical protein